MHIGSTCGGCINCWCARLRKRPRTLGSDQTCADRNPASRWGRARETKDLPAAAAARERTCAAVDRLDATPIVQTGGRLRSTRLPASTGSRRGRSEKTQSRTVRPLLVAGLYIELTDVLGSLPPLTDARLADTRHLAEPAIANGEGAGT